MNTVEINGVELQVNFNDADFIDGFEAAAQKMMEGAAEAQKDRGMRATDSMRKLCEVVNDFFDEAVGEGTAEELFHGNHDMLDHLQAADKFVDAYKGSQREVNNLVNKYVQKQRGQQRQAAQTEMRQFTGRH